MIKSIRFSSKFGWPWYLSPRKKKDKRQGNGGTIEGTRPRDSRNPHAHNGTLERHQQSTTGQEDSLRKIVLKTEDPSRLTQQRFEVHLLGAREKKRGKKGQA